MIDIKLSEKADKVYSELERKSKKQKIAKSIFNSINQKKELIRQTNDYGDIVPKKLIPKKYIEKYKINNLFHVELSNFWRLDYTIITEGERIIIFILNIMDHDKYNKIYGYKKN
jgi:hypothetical protein